MTPPTSRWGTFATEGAVIVASILLALFLDAWWSDREDRADERTALDAMRVEFGQNLDELDLLIEAHGGHVRDLDSFFSSEPGDFEGMDQDSIAIALTEAFTRVMTLDPATSTLDALKSSGRMRIIRDPDLRSDLALWSMYFEDSREEAARMLATLDRSLALLHAVEALHEVPGVPLGRMRPGGAVRVRASEEIGAHAAALTFWRVQYLGELERLRQVTASLLEKL